MTHRKPLQNTCKTPAKAVAITKADRQKPAVRYRFSISLYTKVHGL